MGITEVGLDQYAKTRGSGVDTMSDTASIKTEVLDEHILLITLDRPEIRNAFKGKMAHQLERVELLSNLVYGRTESSGFPADFSFVDPVDEFHIGHG